MTVRPDIVNSLVRVGRDPGLDISRIPVELENLQGHDEINRLGWQEWDRVSGDMVIEDLVALAKALTICEERFRWSGGSVSAVIWVYRAIDRRDSALARTIADWILPRTSNPWVPFGSMNLGARSFREYTALQAAAMDEKTRRARLEAAKVAEGKQKRDQRKESTGRRQAQHIEATASRRAWSVEFVSLPVAEQLRLIADDDQHPLDYFPTACADADNATLRLLDRQVRQKLIDRLKGRRKGPWRRLRLALLQCGA